MAAACWFYWNLVIRAAALQLLSLASIVTANLRQVDVKAQFCEITDHQTLSRVSKIG